jgi:hypothetical protein
MGNAPHSTFLAKVVEGSLYTDRYRGQKAVYSIAQFHYALFITPLSATLRMLQGSLVAVRSGSDLCDVTSGVTPLLFRTLPSPRYL